MSAARRGEPDQAELLERFRGGDEAAFETLFRKYREAAHAVAWRIVGSEDEALDVVQEAFIRAWRGAAGFRADGGFWGWLRRITANAAIERLRARKAARSAELEEETLAEEAHGAEAARLGEEDPVERTSASELAAALRKELARLDPEHRTAISLHAEGLSYKEIAEQMNCPIGTVMSRLFYARRTLAGRLRRHMEP